MLGPVVGDKFGSTRDSLRSPESSAKTQWRSGTDVFPTDCLAENQRDGKPVQTAAVEARERDDDENTDKPEAASGEKIRQRPRTLMKTPGCRTRARVEGAVRGKRAHFPEQRGINHTAKC